MILLTPELRDQLRASYRACCEALRRGEPAPDPVPVVRFFNPLGPATWLATELDEDGILFGLADLGFGCPELGSFALEELESIQLPFGLGIERDVLFEGRFPLSVYAEAASRAGSLVEGEHILRRASAQGASTLSPDRWRAISGAIILAETVHLVHALVQDSDDPDIAIGEQPPIDVVMFVAAIIAVDVEFGRYRGPEQFAARDPVEAGFGTNEMSRTGLDDDETALKRPLSRDPLRTGGACPTLLPVVP